MNKHDNNRLLQNYETALQLKAQVEQLAVEKQAQPEVLEQSIISTKLLYDLALAYIVLYHVSYNASLIKGGYHREHTTIN